MKRVVPGIHSVAEVLKVRPSKIQEIWFREGDLNGELEELFAQARGGKIKVKRVAQRSLDHQIHSHQGVIAFVEGEPPWPSSGELRKDQDCLIYALDGFEDPHNVGSLMRSAWNLGARGVIVPKDNSAGGAPAAQKVATGAFEHVAYAEVANLSAELISLKELGFWVYGLSETGQSIFKTDFAPKAVLVVGSEESGLRKPVLGACDALVGIPSSPSASSFNASVAGALAGFEFSRQRNLSQRLKNSTEKI